MRCTSPAKTTGKQCRRGAIHGGTVCKKHGGGAPQVKKAAAERLKALVHPAIDRINQTIEGVNIPAAVALAAAKDILDRTGHKPVEKHEDVTPESDNAIYLAKMLSPAKLKKLDELLTDDTDA